MKHVPGFGSALYLYLFLTVIFSCQRDRSVDQGDEALTPNIIFIYADDLGYGDLGSYGQKMIKTPHLDRMAEEGMLFTQAYAGHTVCAPSRSALMTGLHTGNTQVRGNTSIHGERVPLPDTAVTITKILKEQGYVNGLFGKWGLGEAGTKGIPTRHDFHQFYGFLNQVRAHSYCSDYVWHNEEPLFITENAGNRCGINTADWYQAKLKDFIRENRNNPFFVYYATQLPHFEARTPEEDLEPYLDEDGSSIFEEALYNSERLHTDPEYARLEAFIEQDHQRGGRTGRPLAAYAGMVTQLDRHVGELNDLLEELGLAEQTLVIFTSDNGPTTEAGFEPDYFNSTGGLKGIKRDLYEGAIRVPMIAKWPGTIPAGSVSDYLWAAWDLMPTVAEMTGAKVPDNIDGVSAVPVLFGKEMERPNALYWETTDNARQRRDRQVGDLSVAIRKGDWKAIANVSLKDGLELYNLKQDPGETQNLADNYPEKIEKFRDLIIESRTPSENWPVDQEIWDDFISN